MTKVQSYNTSKSIHGQHGHIITRRFLSKSQGRDRYFNSFMSVTLPIENYRLSHDVKKIDLMENGKFKDHVERDEK